MKRISVIIPTRNRRDQLHQIIMRLSQNNTNSSVILIADQSDTPLPDKIIDSYKKKIPGLTYLYLKQKGKSLGLNSCINSCDTPLMAFTDDDCLPQKNWLETILNSFEAHPNISIMFGKTLPHQPFRHKQLKCPSIFMKDAFKEVSKPCAHWKNYGFGNNMAFRKKTFDSLGLFKSWLGPQSIGSNAEDAEMSLRALIQGHTILYNPHMVVYHNKWLTPEKSRKQYLSYSCGAVACYGYFAFQNFSFARSITINLLKYLIWKHLKIAKKIVFFQWNKKVFINFIHILEESIYNIRGLSVGFYFSIVDPIKRHEITV